jgi:hypothetical protein
MTVPLPKSSIALTVDLLSGPTKILISSALAATTAELIGNQGFLSSCFLTRAPYDDDVFKVISIATF